MTSGEGIPDTLAWLDWEIPSTEPVEPILRKAFDAHREVNIAKGDDENLYRWEDSHMLSLVTPKHGNEVAVQVEIPSESRKKQIIVGYFSPVDGDFIIYPEAFGEGLSKTDLEAVKTHAFTSRHADIDAFNQTPPKKFGQKYRLDYGHLNIQALHREHFSYIGGNLFEFLEEYNYLRTSKEPSKQLFSDDCTRAAVCLEPKYGGPGAGPEHFLSLRLVGAYMLSGEDNEIKDRQPETYIHIAERDEDDPDGFKLIQRIILPEELSTYVEMAETVDDLALRFMGSVVLDKQKLAFRATPSVEAEQ